MRKSIKILMMILSLSIMYQFAEAQGNCPGNKIKMAIGAKGCGCHCTKKCVDPADTASYRANGWYFGDCLGKFCCGGWIREDDDIPSIETSLTEIYPNPASGIVTIGFTLAQQSVVTLEVFDLMGKHITTIAQDVFGDDGNEVNWDANTVSPGIYFLQMRTDNFSATKRISVFK